MPSSGVPIYVLTGVVPEVLIASFCLALPVSVLLLRLYRRAVVRGMAQGAAAPVAPDRTFPWTVRPPSSPAPLALTYVTPGAGKDAPDGGDLYRTARERRWRASAVYSVAGGVFAATLTFAFLLSGGLGVNTTRFLLLFWTYLWPLVLTLTLVAATTRRARWSIPTVYFTGYAIIGAYAVIRNPTAFSVSRLILLFLINPLPPTLPFIIFLWRRVRAVGPLTVAFFLFATSGSALSFTLIYLNPSIDSPLEGPLAFLAVNGLTTNLVTFATIVAQYVVGFLVFALIGWLVLLLLRRAYRAKWVNDQSLVVDAIWLFFALDSAVDLAFERPLWVLAGPAAFALYLTTIRFGLHLLMRPGGTKGRTLLVLRVFSLGRRSERLFESITRHWRYAGPVQLLAGPDLAETTVEPYQFLDFVTGRLSRQFIGGLAALSRRVDELDTRPDFDGRFRVNDFFCREHMWQATLATLVAEVDAVFMDLRGFSPARHGTTYEIQQLLVHMPLSRIVMLTDATTDHAFLEQTAATAWSALPAGSPNRDVREPRLTMIEAGRSIERSLGVLLAAVSRAATEPSFAGTVETHPPVLSLRTH